MERYHRLPIADIRRAIGNLIFGSVDLSPNEFVSAEAQAEAALKDRDEALRVRLEMGIDESDSTQ